MPLFRDTNYTGTSGRTSNHAGIHITAPVESIDGVWKFTCPPFHYTKTTSLPGHLLHLVEKGSYLLKSNQREYRIKAGDLIYYHGSEIIEWAGNQDEVEFYSVAFTAPALQPLPTDRRVIPADNTIQHLFEKLYQTSLRPNSPGKALRVFSHLTDILIKLEDTAAPFDAIPKKESRWWNVEKECYMRRNFRPAIDELCTLAACSRSTLVRLCREATGMPPLNRFRQIRMAEAKALLLGSTLNISQIAEFLGYPRIHEFSRDFSLFFSISPSKFRNNPETS